ncbi:flagellar export protein FliJ [Lentibacillus cibarius]|uniref:Flagellar FliJ protein n=1 Tax=Lentibacillus cibarius TaxID=2583219 RepID=A0A5S3QNV8_9BACI|nr:flagellar export protein FliJ [Lentibacillus cibarius]TMN23580.1 flagellar export protein FliJ [Lentibacillus cibarius]
MAETVTLSKILHIRENEKQNAQQSYKTAVDVFETTATQLYHLLRTKEEAEHSYDSYMQETAPIDRIREQAVYMERLNRQIMALQQELQTARNEMEQKQQWLNDAYVEVKKFEKIIEHRDEQTKERMKKYENTSMDEISIQQYVNRKPGE